MLNRVKLVVKKVAGHGCSTVLTICSKALEEKGFEVCVIEPIGHEILVEWEDKPSPQKEV